MKGEPIIWGKMNNKFNKKKLKIKDNRAKARDNLKLEKTRKCVRQKSMVVRKSALGQNQQKKKKHVEKDDRIDI